MTEVEELRQQVKELQAKLDAYKGRRNLPQSVEDEIGARFSGNLFNRVASAMSNMSQVVRIMCFDRRYDGEPPKVKDLTDQEYERHNKIMAEIFDVLKRYEE